MRHSSLRRKLEQMTAGKKALHAQVLHWQQCFLEADKALRDNPLKKGNPKKKKE